MTITRAPTRTIADLSDDERRVRRGRDGRNLWFDMRPSNLTVKMTWHDYLARTVHISGTPYNLTGREADILAVLLMRRGHAVPMADIISFIWPNPDDEPEWAESSLITILCRLRGRIPPIIHTHWGRGFLIHLPRPSPAPPLAAISEPVGGGDFVHAATANLREG